MMKITGERDELLASDFKDILERNGNTIRRLELVNDEFIIVFDVTGNEYKINYLTNETSYSKNNGAGTNGTNQNNEELDPFIPGVDPSSIEDFEDDEYIYTIITDEITGWKRTNASGYSANDTYSFRSGNIGNNASSNAEFTINIPDNGLEYYLKFDYRISSESCDILTIKRDGNVIFSTGGSFLNSKVDVPLYTGDNKITLNYSKDGSATSGNDVVSIDNIEVYPRALTAPIIHCENNDDYSVKVSILYPTVSSKRYYSLDGENWQEYDRKLNIPSGTTVYAKYTYKDTQTSEIATKIVEYNYGSNVEDFEDDNFVFEIAGDWERTKDYLSANIIDGRYSFRSKKIGDGGSTTATVTMEVPDNGTDYNILFDYAVSSEGGGDPLEVFINDTKVLSVGGETKSSLSKPLVSGTNTIRFVYSKDGSAGVGKDAAFIDNLRFSQRTLNAPVITYVNSNTGNNVDVTILFNSFAYRKLYSLDDGVTWNNYTGTFAVPSGTTILAKYLNSDGEESAVDTKTVNYLTGSEIEDFEDENMIFTFTGDWERTKDNLKGDIIDGRYSLRSKKIGNNGTTTSSTIITTPNDGTDYYLGLDYKISSEGADILTIKVNGVTILSKGGEEKSSIERRLNSGQNTLEVKYTKDGSAASGNDTAVIDNVRYYQKELAVPTISYVNSSNEGSVDVSILYNTNAFQKYYSIDEGETWKIYTGTFTVTSGTIVYAKYANVAGEESSVISLQTAYSYGTNIENFEDDEMVFEFTGNWYRDRDSALKDKYGYRSAKIGSNGTSTASISINVPDDGYNYVLYFDYFVSSENGCDCFIVKVNNTEVLRKSGSVTSFAELNMSAGTNTINFIYSKDGSADAGKDTAAIDTLQLIRK